MTIEELLASLNECTTPACVLVVMPTAQKLALLHILQRNTSLSIQTDLGEPLKPGLHVASIREVQVRTRSQTQHALPHDAFHCIVVFGQIAPSSLSMWQATLKHFTGTSVLYMNETSPVALTVPDKYPVPETLRTHQ